MWLGGGRQLETAAFVGRNRRGRFGAAPVRGGLANEARNVQLPGVSCDFHPRTMAAAEGQWATFPYYALQHQGRDVAWESFLRNYTKSSIRHMPTAKKRTAKPRRIPTSGRTSLTPAPRRMMSVNPRMAQVVGRTWTARW